MAIRVKLRSVVAWIDFVIGLFLLFGGGNAAVHGGFEHLGKDEIGGIVSMCLGLMLFFSASRITRGHKPRFRPFVYLLIAALFTTLTLCQWRAMEPPVSRQDILAWALVTIVSAVCILLQRALNGSPSMRSQT